MDKVFLNYVEDMVGLNCLQDDAAKFVVALIKSTGNAIKDQYNKDLKASPLIHREAPRPRLGHGEPRKSGPLQT